MPENQQAPLKKLVLVVLLSLSVGVQPALGPHNDPEDVAAVREVVETFRLSIINKDKAAFIGLFYSVSPGHVTWQMVDYDARAAQFKEFVPDARRVVWWAGTIN